jgi:16S rRNA (cytosine967-C5)-methyltransferase
MPPSLSADSRSLALNILLSLSKSDKTLDRILSDHLEINHTISPPDRHLVYAIVYGVLRSRSRLDWILHQFSKTPSGRLDPDIFWILRIGLFQILYLDRIPVSAAVNTSVNLAKQIGKPWLTGFVNGVLRQVVRHHQSVAFPDIEKNPVQAISITHSMPEWIVTRWINRFGVSETSELCTHLNTIPPITLRTHRLNTNRPSLSQALIQQVGRLELTDVSPDGIRLIQLKTGVSQLSGFERGEFQVQDEAAQLVSLMLNPQPGETVLDACGGKGGKTGHMAQLMNDSGQIFAVDMQSDKTELLNTEMRRLKVSIVSTRVYDWNSDLKPDLPACFDRILLDAPCSGLGVLRRNPDIRWRASRQNLMAYQVRQIRLLEKMIPLLKPSGHLVYAVCSMEPEETDAVIDFILETHPGLTVDHDLTGFPDAGRPLIDSNGYLRTLPHRCNMDGFFAVSLIKIKDDTR